MICLCIHARAHTHAHTGRAGFTLPTVDHETLTIRYPDFFTLCEHLRGMGESNANLTRAPHVSSDIFLSAAAAYHELYADEDGMDVCCVCAIGCVLLSYVPL